MNHPLFTYDKDVGAFDYALNPKNHHYYVHKEWAKCNKGIKYDIFSVYWHAWGHNAYGKEFPVRINSTFRQGERGLERCVQIIEWHKKMTLQQSKGESSLKGEKY